MASYDDTATVSGSVVSFADGADEVGLKSCKITLPASLDGYSEIDVKHTGANLLDFTVRDRFGIKCEKTADGGAKMSGTATNTSYPVNWIPLTLPAGTYHIYISAVGTGMTIAYSKNDGYGGNLYAGDNVITLNAETEIGGYIRVSNGTVISEPETVYMQLSVAQADYEPYTAPTVYTASLGRTIHGGQVDIVNGVGENTHGLYTFTGNEVYVQQTNQVAVKVAFMVGSSYQTGLDTAMSAVEDFVAVGCGASNYLYVKTTMTAEDLKTYMANHTILFAYVLASPTDFTFTGQEIPTRLGYNAFWSEHGDTELTYYKDGYGFTSVTIHKETPDGEPVEETRKLHRIIYEGQVDVISGTGLIYRGESGTQYDPPEQISFIPIEVSTDEGENTLYADEGNSAITYRKETE